MRRFESRLERIEKGISGVEGALSRLALDRAWPASAEPSTEQSTQEASPATASASPLPLKHPGRRRLIQRGHDGHEGPERYVGPTVLGSLILDVREFVLDVLNETEHVGVKHAVNAANEHVDQLAMPPSTYMSIQMHSAPEMPPMAMMRAMAQPYIDSINPHLPIWTPVDFANFIEACQAADQNSNQDVASIICANSIVLLTLAAKSVRQRHTKRHTQRATSDQNSRLTTDLDSNLIKAFLLNAKQALDRVDQLFSANMANLRALLSFVS
ncbi:hypothetical protein E4U41_004622 [Claviceps citrina]|nr:hypothetical protein E4U41_004622 [Claviceps citrina]